MNVNCFSVDKNSDNFNFRYNVIDHLNPDILGIAESHLKGQEKIEIKGHSRFVSNRCNLHRNSRNGSGVCVIFINNCLNAEFEVSVCNDKVDGILWLKFKHKFDLYESIACICYLPSKCSARQICQFLLSHTFI